jgi:phage baseplate assembly protein W
MISDEAFLGKGWSFPPQFFSSGAEVELVSGEEDIRQSLYILFGTALNERVMFSSFGCELSRYLFEEIDQALINGLTGIIEDAILNNEPRIDTDAVDVTQSSTEAGLLLISISYTIRATNNRYNMVYPFYINEANT